jgi:RNA polymerase-associated protein CTR9
MVDASNAGTGRTVRDVGNDPEFFVEMAKIWHGVSLEKSAKAYRSAVRTRREIGEKESPQLVNNLAALAHLDGDFESAEGLYKEALASFGEASIDGEEQVRATKTTLLYNLGRAYEGRGKLDEARDSYREILSIHPEYADGSSLPFIYLSWGFPPDLS